MVEAACVAGGGTLDIHVLMSLAVLGTLVLGMAEEVSSALNPYILNNALQGFFVSSSPFCSRLQGTLLMLLFQISHFLEENFTSRARGSIERLFSSIPTEVCRTR